MRLTRLRHHLATRLWVLPMSVALAGAILAVAALLIDKANHYELIPPALTGPPTVAQVIISTFIGSLVTLISIVMSVITVAVQLAMQQFSPRIVRPLLQDRRTQFSVGLFAATLIASLIVLPQTYSHAPGKGVELPGLAILYTEVLMLASVVALILYVHHAGQSMRVGNLIDLVGDQSRETILRELSPSGGGKDEPDVIASPAAGAIYNIEYGALVEAAREADVRLELIPAMGDFVPTTGPLFRIHGDAGNLDRDEVMKMVWLGGERTHENDAAYGIRKLVDIAERGVQEPFADPTTTSMALDRLHDLLRLLATRELPDGRYTDGEGELRLTVPARTWDDYVLLAFEEIRVGGVHSPQVPRRLRAALEDLLTVAPPERREPLERQLSLLEAALERHTDEERELQRANTADRQGFGSSST